MLSELDIQMTQRGRILHDFQFNFPHAQQQQQQQQCSVAARQRDHTQQNNPNKRLTEFHAYFIYANRHRLLLREKKTQFY